MNNKIFFQHPDLMRQLRVHEDVMTIMMNVLINQQSAVDIEYTDQGIANFNVGFILKKNIFYILGFFFANSVLNAYKINNFFKLYFVKKTLFFLFFFSNFQCDC